MNCLPIIIKDKKTEALSWAILDGSDDDDDNQYYHVYDFSAKEEKQRRIIKDNSKYIFIIPDPLNTTPQCVTKAFVRKELGELEDIIKADGFEVPDVKLDEEINVIDICPDECQQDGWCKIFSPVSQTQGLFPIVYLEFCENF